MEAKVCSKSAGLANNLRKGLTAVCQWHIVFLFGEGQSEQGRAECPGKNGEEFLCRLPEEAMSKLFEEMAQ
jgi:hypothetical protein